MDKKILKALTDISKELKNINKTLKDRNFTTEQVYGMAEPIRHTGDLRKTQTIKFNGNTGVVCGESSFYNKVNADDIAKELAKKLNGLK